MKANGEKYENILANVQDKLITIPNADAPIDEGDQFIRELPHGKQEIYEVINPKYYGSIGGIQPHYQVDVRKVLKGNQRSKAQEDLSHRISINGNNSPVIINSNDNYINIDTSSINDGNVFEILREFISKNTFGENKEKIISSVDEMEKAKGTSGYVKAYKSFMQVAKDCMTIISPFIPYLSNHLS